MLRCQVVKYCFFSMLSDLTAEVQLCSVRSSNFTSVGFSLPVLFSSCPLYSRYTLISIIWRSHERVDRYKLKVLSFIDRQPERLLYSLTNNSQVYYFGSDTVSFACHGASRDCSYQWRTQDWAKWYRNRATTVQRLDERSRCK